MYFIYLPIILLSSVMYAVANPIYGKAGREMGVFRAVTQYLGVGTIVMIVLMVVNKEPFSLEILKSVPWFTWANAAINVVVLSCMVFLMPRIGVGLQWASSVTGQFIAALIFDGLGIFHDGVSSINALKICGAILILVGTIVFSLNMLKERTKAKDSKLLPIWLGMLIGVGAGTIVTTMGGINGITKSYIGTYLAVLLYLGGGFILSIPVTSFFSRNNKSLNTVFKSPAYFCIPGILNAFSVVITAIIMPVLGVGVYTATNFLISIFSNLFIDKLGLLGMPKIPISKNRIIGAVIMFIGVVLFNNQFLF